MHIIYCKQHSSNKNKISSIAKNTYGFTMIELMLVLLVGSVIASSTMQVYNRVESSQWINKNLNNIVQAIVAIENVKVMRNGTLPSQSENIAFTNPSNPMRPYVGSDVRDLVGIEYKCPAGTPSTVTVTFTADLLPDADLIEALRHSVIAKLDILKYTVGPVVHENSFIIYKNVSSCI